MSLIRVPSEFCHSFKDVCAHLIKEGDDQALYDYVTSLRGCDCNIDQSEYVIVKSLTTSVLRGDNDGTGGMDITNTIELFANKEAGYGTSKASREMCKYSIEHCSEKSGHHMLHVAWGFKSLGTYYESVAQDRLCAVCNDDIVLKLQNVSTNCAAIARELQNNPNGEFVVRDIYELLTDITIDSEDDDDEKRVRWISSEKFKKFME